jgi:hypothetical protein
VIHLRRRGGLRLPPAVMLAAKASRMRNAAILERLSPSFSAALIGGINSLQEVFPLDSHGIDARL